MSIAKRVHKACMAACRECPQFRGDIEDSKLHKRGIAAVLAYWRDIGTIGGALLMDKSYYEALPADIQEIFERADAVINAALEREFGRS